MISKAIAKYLRISPRKVRTVIALIKDKHVDEAIGILSLTNKKASFLLLKVLNSAIANAKRFPNMQQENLYISDIYANGGPLLKRTMAGAMGRASVIRKTTSHITIELDMKQPKILEQAAGNKNLKVKKAKITKNVITKKKTAVKKSEVKKVHKKTKKKAREGVKSGA